MPPPPTQTQQIVDNLFRHESGRIVAVLTKILGFERLELAEDAVQEGLLKALQVWPYKGIPENPAAWIMQIAKNKALDVVRRENGRDSRYQKSLELSGPPLGFPEFFSEREIQDDQLRMMFACCHPSLSLEAHVALILRTLCGFSEDEIARAFLSNKETVHKRLVRAKQKLREIKAALEIPDPVSKPGRLASVFQALYLLFNEGYKASSGATLTRKELCDEATRLTRILSQHFSGDTPEAHGLLALMLFHGSRLGARTDDLGNLLLLQEQDRNSWDGKMIREGFSELEKSAEGNVLSRYQLEAGIAACHCLAPKYEDTDWARILDLYDLLVGFNDSPIVYLNRAVALARVEGPEAGIRAIGQIRGERLEQYYLLHAVLGEFHAESGNPGAAARCFRKALELTQLPSERVFLTRKLEGLVGHD